MSKQCILLAALVLVLAGCITHTPMSETALFHDPTTRFVHDRGTGIGFVGTYAPSPAAVLKEAESQFPEIAYRLHDLQINPNRVSGGLYFSVYESAGNFALSGTIGAFVAGVDASAQVWRRNYVTVSYSAPGQVQGYFQHRAYNSPDFGAAVGFGYRRDLYAFSQPSECTMCLVLDYVDVRSFGIRGFGVYRGEGDTGGGGGLRFGLYAGYAPVLGQPVVEATLTVGLF